MVCRDRRRRCCSVSTVSCRLPSRNPGSYLREVVLDISGTWCVDPHRVHAEGHSSGALMAARLACDAPDVFASIAVYAGVDPTLLGSPCAQDQALGRPISMGIFHGINDAISRFPLAIEHRDKWIKRNDCSSIPQTEPNVQVEASVYGPCRAGVEVVWRVYNAGHLWPKGPDHADITSRMWAFFQRTHFPNARTSRQAGAPAFHDCPDSTLAIAVRELCRTLNISSAMLLRGEPGVGQAERAPRFSPRWITA
jgi:poly(3-hydroxybutyrate) depolymerase